MHRIQRPQSVIIKVKERKDAERLKPKLESLGLKIREPQNRLPQLKIRNIDSTLSNDEIQNSIIALNGSEGFNDSSVKVVGRKKNPSNAGQCTIFLEVSKELGRKYHNGGRIYVGFQCLQVIPNNQILQYFCCGRFGHKAVNCRDKPADQTNEDKRLCLRCGAFHEKTNRCENAPKCVNCCRTNEARLRKNLNVYSTKHSADDHSKCPIAIARVNELNQQIYG